MRALPGLLAVAALASTASAAFQGFNYGNVFTDGKAKGQSDFEAEFKTAQGLEGTDGAFNSARLYTMIVRLRHFGTPLLSSPHSFAGQDMTHTDTQQGGTGKDVIEAIPAAIKTKTTLLLGLWASAGRDAFDSELAALEKAISAHGDDLAPLVAGISVGSEDLYRNSPTGIAAGEYAGADPSTLVDYIDRVRKAIKGTALSDAKIGHVDTWSDFVNGSNSAVVEACDWLGMDAYPYFEDGHPNGVSEGGDLFRDALRQTRAAAGDKEVWITETGWPVSGEKKGAAVPSRDNARSFWRDVGCPMFGETNVWWYTLQDAAPDTPDPSFGVVEEVGGEPLFDLSCEGSDGDGGESASRTEDASSGSSSHGLSGGSASPTEDASGGSSSHGSSDGESASPTEDVSSDSSSHGSSGGSANPTGDSNESNDDLENDENGDAEPGDDGGDGGGSSLQLNSIAASVVAILGAVALL